MKKILVAEDDQFLSQAYKVKLTKAGFEVLLAANGNEALALMNQEKPDLVILDLIMPTKDGFAVLAERQKNEQLKKIPVMIASNLGQTEDINRGMSLGAQEYFIKSDLSLEDLIQKINQILN